MLLNPLTYPPPRLKPTTLKCCTIYIHAYWFWGSSITSTSCSHYDFASFFMNKNFELSWVVLSISNKTHSLELWNRLSIANEFLIRNNEVYEWQVHLTLKVMVLGHGISTWSWIRKEKKRKETHVCLSSKTLRRDSKPI